MGFSLEEYAAKNIFFKLSNGGEKIAVQASEKNITPELILEIKEYKTDIIEQLKKIQMSNKETLLKLPRAQTPPLQSSPPENLKNKSYSERLHWIKQTTKLPNCFCEELSKILTYPMPDPFMPKSWANIICNCQYMIQNSEKFCQMMELGWTLDDFFGCHPIAPEKRFDYIGYILSHRHHKVIDFDEKKINIQTASLAHLQHTKSTGQYPQQKKRISTFFKEPLLEIDCPSLSQKSAQRISQHLSEYRSPSQWRQRTGESINSFVLIQENIPPLQLMTLLFEQGYIKIEYSGIYLPTTIEYDKASESSSEKHTTL